MSPNEFADLRAQLLKLEPHEASKVLGTVVRRVEPDLQLKAVHDVLSGLLSTGAGNDTFRLRQIRNDIDLRLQVLERRSA